MRSSVQLPSESGQFIVQPNPVTAGGEITVTYLGEGPVFWRVAGPEGSDWQPVPLGSGSRTATVRVPVDAPAIDFSNLKLPNPAGVSVPVVVDPIPDDIVP